MFNMIEQLAKFLPYVAVAIQILIFVYWIGKLSNRVDTVELNQSIDVKNHTSFLLKEDFYRQKSDIENRLTKIEEKIDKLIDLQIQSNNN